MLKWHRRYKSAAPTVGESKMKSMVWVAKVFALICCFATTSSAQATHEESAYRLCSRLVEDSVVYDYERTHGLLGFRLESAAKTTTEAGFGLETQ